MYENDYFESPDMPDMPDSTGFVGSSKTIAYEK